jgi:hypothetical protein
MVSRWQDWNPQGLAALREGVVIPAHPLALDANRKLDTRRQRALTRYYLDAGAGGLAVGVHTTQFAIREAGLFEPVLKLAMRSAEEWARASPIMIAGLVGRTAQAVKEAELARGLGYHAGLLSLAALEGASEDELIAHAQTVAREIPLGDRSRLRGLSAPQRRCLRAREFAALALLSPAIETPFIPAHSASKTRVNALMAGIQKDWVPAFAGTNGCRTRQLAPNTCLPYDGCEDLT